MTGRDQRVAVITGASQGIWAGLAAGYRRLGWVVMANARAIKVSEDPDVLAVEGDISEPATADRITGDALARFCASTTVWPPRTTGRLVGKATSE